MKKLLFLLICILLIGCNNSNIQQTNYQSDECWFVYDNIFLQGIKDNLTHKEFNKTINGCCCVDLSQPRQILCMCAEEDKLKNLFSR